MKALSIDELLNGLYTTAKVTVQDTDDLEGETVFWQAAQLIKELTECVELLTSDIDVIAAAHSTKHFLPATKTLPLYHSDYGLNHLRSMLADITSHKVRGYKAHRWLGWVQCAVVIGGGASRKEMQTINIK